MTNDVFSQKDPFLLFNEWMDEAKSSEINDPEAACLATVSPKGLPHARMVLLRGWGVDGFWFNTNAQSVKGQDLAQNPFAALCIHWKSLKRQIRVEGEVKLLGAAESDAYFAKRPRYSQLGAWASRQSEPLESLGALHERVKAIEAQYEGQDVPRPDNWHGYVVIPHSIEFWQQQDFRLHDRFVYKPQPNGVWHAVRLYP